jgi:hypothetical protein
MVKTIKKRLYNLNGGSGTSILTRFTSGISKVGKKIGNYGRNLKQKITNTKNIFSTILQLASLRINLEENEQYMDNLFTILNRITNGETNNMLFHLDELHQSINFNITDILDLHTLKHKYENNPRCIEFYKKHPNEPMLNVLKLFLSLNIENINEIYRNELDKIIKFLPIIDNLIDYSKINLNDEGMKLLRQIPPGKIFTTYAHKITNDFQINDIEILLQFLLAVLFQSPKDKNSIIHKINMLLEFIRIIYWNISYLLKKNPINTHTPNSQMANPHRHNINKHIEKLKTELNSNQFPSIFKLMNSITSCDSLICKRLLNYFLQNKIDIESLDNILNSIGLYEDFKTPLSDNIGFINIQINLIKIIENNLVNVRKYVNLGILDDILNIIRSIAMGIPSEVINNTGTQAGGKLHDRLKSFHLMMHKIMDRIIQRIYNPKQTDSVELDFTRINSVNPDDILGTNSNWNDYRKLNKDIDFKVLIFNILDNSEISPILSAIISSISIKGGAGDLFQDRERKILIKYFNDYIYSYIYKKPCTEKTKEGAFTIFDSNVNSSNSNANETEAKKIRKTSLNRFKHFFTPLHI